MCLGKIPRSKRTSHAEERGFDGVGDRVAVDLGNSGGVGGHAGRHGGVRKPDRRLDHQVIRFGSLPAYSMPVFWLGLVGLLLCYAKLGWVWRVATIPGMAIFIVVLRFNLLGDLLRNMSDWPTG